MEAEKILAAPMGENDADAKTVGDYLAKLLITLFQQEESFSGKRPFGNSGWVYEPMKALVKAGAMPGTVDRDGEVSAAYGDLCKAVELAVTKLRP